MSVATTSETRHFGHRYFGWYRPLFDVDGRGLTLRGRAYAWCDVVGFQFAQSGAAGWVPSARLRLADGRSANLDVMYFCERGRPRQAAFVTGVTRAFSDFARLLEQGTGRDFGLRYVIYSPEPPRQG